MRRSWGNLLSESSNDSFSSESSSDTSVTTATDTDLGEPECKKQKRTSPSSDKETKFVNEVHYEYVLKANYKWVIKDFIKITSDFKYGQKVESSVFHIGGSNEYEFQLQLFPKGVTESQKNHLSLLLLVKSCIEPQLTIQFKCSLLNNKFSNKDFDVKETVARGQKCGFKRLIRTDSIQKSSGYLDHDRIVFNCAINVTINKTDDCKTKVVDDIETLLLTGDHSDVILEVQERQFKAHKCILSARSEVFAAMFRHNTNEKNENIVKITDIRPEVMEEVLRFIYFGEVLNLENSTKEVLAAADKYNFEGLKKLCESALGKTLSINNVVELLNFAERYNANNLKELALNFFAGHVKDVVDTQLFQTMANKESPLLTQIINKIASKN
ncbi:speckle-type POZ protein isoform X2 [Copidosoma floridanum]|nr:speckle-type POZ protein isoform X2 [Copidosoma floridanum]